MIMRWTYVKSDKNDLCLICGVRNKKDELDTSVQFVKRRVCHTPCILEKIVQTLNIANIFLTAPKLHLGMATFWQL